MLTELFLAAKRTRANYLDYACSLHFNPLQSCSMQRALKPVQDIQLAEQIKTTLTVNVYFWDEKKG